MVVAPFVPVRGGSEMYLIESDTKICTTLRYKGQWEPGVADVIEKYANPDWTFLDLGAHCGFFTLLASGLFKDVIAVEPNPEAYSVLARNLNHNQAENVELHKAAVWDDDGGVQFVPIVNNSGMSWVSRFEREGSIGLPSQTLDQILGDRYPEFWKVDIEGAEYRALVGQKDYLDAVQVMVLEYSTSQLDRTSKATGRDLYDMLDDFDWLRLDGEPVAFRDLPAGGYDNFLLLRKETRA